MASKPVKAEKAPAERPKVVVIDDDTSLLQVLKDGLSDDYEVHGTSDAQEGLRLVENVAPSVVILDVEMPVMDGFAICEAIREAGWVHHIPVLFLTAHGGEAFASDARKAGGDAF